MSDDERLAAVDREVEQIRQARAEQALRVTAGFTIAELQAMPNSALRRWQLDRAVLLAACEAYLTVEHLKDPGAYLRGLDALVEQMRAAVAEVKGRARP